jgi:hypothetical protein
LTKTRRGRRQLSSIRFISVQNEFKPVVCVEFFELFVRSLGEGASEPKVRLTVACPFWDGPFSLKP